DLPLRRLRVGIAVEARAGRRVLDPADRLADLVGGAADAAAVRVAQRLAARDVELDDRGPGAGRQGRWHAADRARPVLDAVGREIAFGRGVELEAVREGEALRDFLPCVGAQAVAAGGADAGPGLARMRRRVDEIAGELADVLHQRAVMARHVVPEPARREFL